MKELAGAWRLFLLLTVLTGFAYPAATTGVAAICFPHARAGSPAHLVSAAGEHRVVGSKLVGQHFSAPGYFWGRPSATPERPYNPRFSSGSNLAASNPALAEQAAARAAALHASDPGQQAAIPGDLVTASASGLDPDISLAAARWQAPRVARARGLAETQIAALIDRETEKRELAFLGEPRVNVLRLNLALDALAATPAKPAAP